MSAATAVEQVEAVVLRPESPDAPGVVRVNGGYYDVTSGPLGFAFERLSTGSVYHVRVAGGKPAGCDCPAAKYTRHRGICKHEFACQVLLGAW